MPADLIAYPFTSQVTYDEQGLPLYDRPVDAEVLRNIQKQYFTDGVFAVPATSFQVSPVDGGMTVQVAPGSGTIQGTTGYRTTPVTLDIEAAGSVDRVDAIVLRWDDSLDVRAIQLDVVRGASNGAYPTPTRTDTIWEMIIAYVRVRANATSITVADVEDTRLNTALCGLVRLPMAVPDTDPYFEQIQAYIDYLSEVINGVIDGSEYLLKTRYDPDGDIGDVGGFKAYMARIYRVGSYYFSQDPTNPAELFGFGTWERAAIGRMLIGVNENDTPFNAPGKTGGNQTHTLAAANIPSHRHTVPALSGSAASDGAHTHNSAAHTHALAGSGAAAVANGNHTHNVLQGGRYPASPWCWVNGTGIATMPQGNWTTDKDQLTLDAQGTHTHSLTGTSQSTTPGATGSAGAHTHTVATTANNTGYYGSGTAVNHMNPYETAYIWKRTA